MAGEILHVTEETLIYTWTETVVLCQGINAMLAIENLLQWTRAFSTSGILLAST